MSIICAQAKGGTPRDISLPGTDLTNPLVKFSPGQACLPRVGDHTVPSPEGAIIVVTSQGTPSHPI